MRYDHAAIHGEDRAVGQTDKEEGVDPGAAVNADLLTFLARGDVHAVVAAVKDDPRAGGDVVRRVGIGGRGGKGDDDEAGAAAGRAALGLMSSSRGMILGTI